MTSISIGPLIGVSPEAPPRRTETARAVMSPWAWLAVTCVLLGLSGGLRFWREWQFSALSKESEASPFPLSQIPRTLGTWQSPEGSEAHLDPEIARIAGASDYIARDYDDARSGERASVLVVYGLGNVVAFHTPDVCYPATGHRPVKGPIDRMITVPGVEAPVHYRWAIYSKQVGAITRYEECYFTFLHKGDWLPDTQDRWKLFRYYPGAFKIQIAHAVSGLSETGEGPCESLLAELARQISDRSAPPGAQKAGASGPTPPPATR